MEPAHPQAGHKSVGPPVGRPAGMAQRGLLRAWLLLLFWAGASSPHCSGLWHQLPRGLSRALQLLDQVAGRFPLECLGAEENLRFPRKVFGPARPRRPNAMLIAQQICHQVLDVFSRNLPPATWARDSLEAFLRLLDRQAERLGPCGAGRGSPRPAGGKLRKYFRRVQRFLRRGNQSDCAWEIVRAETRRGLQMTELLVARHGTAPSRF
ncbi:interferon alpha-12-like [Ornithorhynchus anatinus]|uniref:interferon alpha-12-like n=1 Tax=Ornithorhynchus anatinus TaxID=9258 RepID=UPI0019D4E28F|nr:interferon alpha-12-like [Ornithorhynchus anatinus]